MIYSLLPAAILAMLGYMFWHAGFRLRRDRVAAERVNRRARLRIVRKKAD